MTKKPRTRLFFKGYIDFFGPEGAQRLSPRAQAMLISLMVQYDRTNNGSLKLTASFLPHWLSADIKQKARNELIAEGFIVEVSKGGRPNRASLYAVTCEPLNPNPEHDPELVANFVPDAWRDAKSGRKTRSNRGRNLLRASEQRSKNVCSETRNNPRFASPIPGVESALIAPALGALARSSLLRIPDTSLESTRSVVLERGPEVMN